MIPRSSSFQNAQLPKAAPAPGPNKMRLAVRDDGEPSVRFTKNPGSIAVACEYANGARVGNFPTDYYVEFPEFTDDNGNTVRRAKKDGTPYSDKAVEMRWADILNFLSQIQNVSFDKARDILSAAAESDDPNAALLDIFGAGEIPAGGGTFCAITEVYQKEDAKQPGRYWDNLRIARILSPEQYDVEVKKSAAAAHSSATQGGRKQSVKTNAATASKGAAVPPPDVDDDEEIPF